MATCSRLNQGSRALSPLIFALLRSQSTGEPVIHKPRKPALLNHADEIEVIVAAVFLCCFGMEHIGALHPQLVRDEVGDFFR